MVKIISLVENHTECGCRTAHALSLYIETPNHRLLFDVGSDDTFIENANRLGVDLKTIDTVIISHGHRDHGGALPLLLEINTSAKVYILRQAFAPHYSHRASGVANIGLDPALMDNKRVVLLDGDYKIDSELTLFKSSDNSLYPSGANASLYQGDTPDKFEHEQNLIIHTAEPVLIMGCGHNGVVNILNRAKEYSPRVCVGGFHLTNPSARRDEPKELIDKIIEHLKSLPDMEFYTCHCTGINVYNYMRSKMSNIHYLSCGQTINLGRKPQTEILLDKLSSSWDGSQLPHYPLSQPRFTMQKVVIPPKTRMERHNHSTMNLGYILEGELTITADDGTTATFREGEGAIEIVDKFHYGENCGDKDTVVVVISIQ